jgi:hypothetical protein
MKSMHFLNPKVGFDCCFCGDAVNQTNPDDFSLEVRSFGGRSPYLIWAHGPCLRKAIPVAGAEIPGEN